MRRPRKSINQINVVPYIDVMLVLLVIFMVTAPLINPGEIELPSVGSTLTAPAQPLEVTLNTDGTLSLQDQQAGGPAARCRATSSSRASGRSRRRLPTSRWSSPPTETPATRTCSTCSTSCSATA